MLTHLALLVYSAMLYVGGWQQAREPGGRAERARGAGLPATEELVRASGWGMILGATALHIPALRRLAALSLALQLVPITWAGHRYWELEEGPQRGQQRIHFFKNVSLIGGALYIAATADRD
jgi:putative oxidoreductase